ncbi:hypothetical protein BBAD15_g12178 [Beauveria bassiana D1-5]|uniref:Uncharacterized protein n=1 Tax=Beauveria bassiana D1-5 TaxID=1245745 RepID=A0A0A2V559_BEABA|nr:hypothetical protein BBAD15_g12178 [Beauveria bassiana D1-5]
MVFFSSLLASVPVAARWLIANSGAIGDVVQSIRKVAGLEAVEDEDDDFTVVPHSEFYAPEVTFEKLEKDIKNANKYLNDKAAADLKPPETEQRSVLYPRLNMLWTEPSHPVGKNGIPSAEMYRDLALTLNEHKVPLDWTNKGGKPIDVALHLGQALFANSPNAGSTIRVDEKTDIRNIPVCLESKGGGCIINAQHVYYEVPMGRAGKDYVWQAALHMNISQTQEFHNQYKLEQAGLVYVSQSAPPTGPVWILTCEVDWRTVLLAKNAAHKLALDIESQKGYHVAFSDVEANFQKIKVVVESQHPPAQVRAVIETAAGAISNNVNKSSLHLLDHAADPLTAQGPAVKVTNASFKAAWEATNDYHMAVRRLAAEAVRLEIRQKKDTKD